MKLCPVNNGETARKKRMHTLYRDWISLRIGRGQCKRYLKYRDSIICLWRRIVMIACKILQIKIWLKTEREVENIESDPIIWEEIRSISTVFSQPVTNANSGSIALKSELYILPTTARPQAAQLFSINNDTHLSCMLQITNSRLIVKQ